jgi:archaellum component FlaC
VEGAPPHRPAPSQRPEPLSADDLRGLRRWVIVAGVWAVAATAVALIALLDTSDGQAEKDADAAANRVAKAERTLDGRLDALETRLEEVPRSDDVSKLQQRLSRAEKSASDAAESSKGAAEKVGDLEDRVEQLEEDAASGGAADEEQP